MIEDAMQKKFEAILVFHTSRFARNVAEARQYKELLRKKQGIDVIFVTQQFGDYDNPSSFLNEGVNELFDEYYSRQLSFWVRSTLMEKRKQGKQNGNPPLGYYKRKIGFDQNKNRPIYDPKWQIDTKESALVVRIYKMYATGRYSYSDIAEILNKEGLQTKYKLPFTYSTMKGVLGNKVYLGFVGNIRKTYEPIPGEHPPIVKDKLFNEVQKVIQERRNTKGRPVAQHRFYLLQDLAYCHRCIKYLKGKEDKPYAKFLPKMYCETHSWEYPKGVKRETLQYCCKLKRETKTCDQPDVKTSIIDEQVLQFMAGFNLPSDVVEKTLANLRRLFDVASGSAKDTDMVAKLQNKKKKLHFQFQNTDMYTEMEYLKAIREIDTQLTKYDNLGLVDNSAKLKASECIKKTEEFLRDFKKFWTSEIGDQERREWLLITIKRVWVKDQKVIAIEPHDDYKALFSSHKKLFVQSPSATPENFLRVKIVCLS
jgi:DNA invertase Pin-like site-specific DNA recombinase